MGVMFTSKQTAKLAGIGHSTVRHYALEWAEYLSASATPPAGEVRHFTDEDVAVFRTIRVMRDRGATTEQIIAALDAGDRYEPLDEPPEPPEPKQEGQTEDDRSLAPLELFERILEPFQERIDKLESRLDTEQEARLDAEKRAAAAEALAFRIHGWQFWKPKRPETNTDD